MTTDHLVHIHEQSHRLAHNTVAADQRPSDFGLPAGGLQCELRAIASLEWPEEFQRDVDLPRGCRARDLHASGADLVIAFPGVDRAFTCGCAAVIALKVRINVFV